MGPDRPDLLPVDLNQRPVDAYLGAAVEGDAVAPELLEALERDQLRCACLQLAAIVRAQQGLIDWLSRRG